VRTLDSRIILVHKVTLDELDGEGRLADTWQRRKGEGEQGSKYGRTMTYHPRRRLPAYIPVKTEPGDTAKKDDKEPSRGGERVDEPWTFKRIERDEREGRGKRPRRVQKERKERRVSIRCEDRLRRSKASNDRSSHAASLGRTRLRFSIPFNKRRSRSSGLHPHRPPSFVPTNMSILSTTNIPLVFRLSIQYTMKAGSAVR
jgi:hypothetical protein